MENVILYFEKDFNVAMAEAFQRWKQSRYLETYHVINMYDCGFLVVADDALDEHITNRHDCKIWRTFGPKEPAHTAEVIDGRHIFKTTRNRNDSYSRLMRDMGKLFGKE